LPGGNAKANLKHLFMRFQGQAMSDPVTIGYLVAQAVALAAPEILKTSVGEATKDAYKALKDKIAHWAGAEVAALEAAPSSKGKQLAVAELIDDRPEDERETLRAVVQALVEHLKKDAPVIGLDIGALRNVETELGNITARTGIGARIGGVEGGKLKIGDITTGEPSGN
jgi:hypothetical protein